MADDSACKASQSSRLGKQDRGGLGGPGRERREFTVEYDSPTVVRTTTVPSVAKNSL